MNRSIAAFAVMIASPLAWGQSWEFRLTRPVLAPGAASTEVILSLDPGPGAYAVAGVGFHVHATEPGWSDQHSRIPRSASPPPDPLPPGQISGSSILGISLGQLTPLFGFTPIPGRLDMWGATFTVTDFTARQIDLSTETLRLSVYLDDITWDREDRTPIEGAAQITVVPAPGSAALLGVGAAAGLRRRRRNEAMT